MRGFNRDKYMRVMEKLNENRPKEYCEIGVKYSNCKNCPTLVISNIPCVIDITNFGSTWENGGYIVEKAVTYTIEKKYLEGKTFSNGVALRIESLLANNETGGYYFNSITPKPSNVLNEEGYPFGTLPVLYGEYADGAYREYINLYTVDRRVKV